MNVVYDVEMDFDIVEDEIVIHLVIILLIPDVTMCAGVLNIYQNRWCLTEMTRVYKKKDYLRVWWWLPGTPGSGWPW